MSNVSSSATIAQADTPDQAIAKKMIARFPIVHPPIQDVNVANQSHAYDVGVKSFQISINKSAPDDQIGRVDVSVHLHCSDRAVGFDGACLCRFKDEQGNIIWALLTDVHGIAPTSDPTYPSELNKDEVHYIPIDVLTAIYSVDIEPRWVPSDTLGNLQKSINDICKGADAIKDGLKKVGATVAEIIAAIKAL